MLDFLTQSPMNVRALFVGERIDLRTLESTECLDESPLTIKVGQHGLAILQRYGTVVLFNLDSLEEASFLEELKPWIKKGLTLPEVESAQLLMDESAREPVRQDGRIVLEKWTVEHLQVVGDLLAKSALLSYYESNIAEAFASIEPIATNFQRQRHERQPESELLKHIGTTLIIQQTMVGLVEIEEKPELLWDHPELDRLYLRLEDEYEIRERHRAIERKLQLISNTASTVWELMQHRSGIRLEWYIIGLILIETLLTLYEILFLK